MNIINEGEQTPRDDTGGCRGSTRKVVVTGIG